ncbi:15-hydroxyprostaglandin dehydrogenase [NAD(+)] [Parasteatoda tepidariorum]|uniref:15-hydroxyprostaglandin dehydrogenase [NAD(+)] n=1 Tax=Parasteatoda tepidariorum TaxID=114398 RepID=UPI0039BCF904
MDFEKKVAIVTGGAQGIGKSYCSLLLKMGMKVCICDIKETPNELISDLQKIYKDDVIYQKCDVSSFSDFKNAFERTKQLFGRIDVVVNNAGIVNELEWKKMIEVNLIGVIHGIQLGFQYMSTENRNDGGFIINTISNTGVEPFPLAPVYSGTKHAVVGLTRSYGADYHFNKTGVKVCGIAPGPVDTDLTRNFHLRCLDEREGKELVASVTTVTPDDIAKGLLKLLKDDKNGIVLRVDSSGMYLA